MESQVGNLESLLAPISYGDEYALPRDIPGKPTLLTGVHFNGHVSDNCEWGWAYSQSVIRCFPLPVSDEYTMTQGPLAVCPEPYQFPDDCFITCATELTLHNPRVTNGVSRLVIGLNFRNCEGGFVIFDPMKAQPIKLVMLPSAVTSITVISHFEDTGFNSHFFNEAMMAMVGVVAVGLRGGQVIILDLGLDQLPNSSLAQYKNVFVKRPYKPVFVTPHEPNIALKRHQLIGEKKVIGLSVLNASDEDDLDTREGNTASYHFSRPDKTKIRTFFQRNVRVTAVEYVSQIGLFIVGFDFGGFQIWRVDRLQLVYTSSIPPRPCNGVFGFSFSQPVDDPKNYCYLWVMYGKAGLEMGHSNVELYCIEFQDKPALGNLGYIYKGFVQCIKKLSFKLEDQFDDAISGEGNDHAEGRFYVRPLKIWNLPSRPNSKQLTFFAWESARIGIYYVGVFDLNQWYSSRMPESLCFMDVTKLCPFWVAIPVETTDQYRAIPVCDVQIIPTTLERWRNPHCTLDIHMYPASLSFEAITLSQSATSSFQFFGVQEKLLRKLIDDGTNLMIQPAHIRHMFKTYGVRPILPQNYDSSVPKEMADRFYIFSSLLDNRRPAMIIQLAGIWLDGGYANVGCTIDLILNWISSYTFSLRVVATSHWTHLHQCHLEFLAPETQHFIYYSNFAWESLRAIFTTITRPDEVYLVREEFINNLSIGLNKIVRYSSALRMMFNAQVLPEKSDCDIISLMMEDHLKRRKNVERALQDCDLLGPEFRSVRPMMIDYLLETFDEDELREQWHVEPNEPVYPPKHIGYILNLFLLDEIDPKDVARIAAYFLLDIRDVVTPEQKDKLCGDYLSVMQLTAEEEAEVYHLWLMDQGYGEEMMIFLTHPGRLTSYELPWCAVAVILTATGMEESVKQLLKRSCPLVLSQLFVNLMSTSAGVFSSMFDTSAFKTLCRDEDFLVAVFTTAYEKGFLGELIAKSLRHVPPFAVQVLIDFLNKTPSFEFYDWLLAVYCHTGDIKNLEMQYNRMKQFCESRLLNHEQNLRWMLREKVVLSILDTEQSKSSGVLAFIRKCDKKSSATSIARPIIPPIVIRPCQVPSTPPPRPSEEEDCIVRNRYNKLPLQFQRLKESQGGVLSPLRRYAVKLQSVLRTPHRGNTSVMDGNTSIVTDPVEPTPAPRLMISILNYPNEDDIPEEEDEDEEYNPANEPINGNISHVDASFLDDSMDTSRENKSYFPSPSPINLKSFLEPPVVNHKEGRKSISIVGETPLLSQSMSTIGSANRPLYFSTGSVGGENLHSIMKKRDSTSRRNMELRFLDTSMDSKVGDEEIAELSNMLKPTSDDEEQRPLESIVDIKPKRSPRGKMTTRLDDQSVSTVDTKEDAVAAPPSSSSVKKTTPTRRSRSKTPVSASDDKQLPPPHEANVDISPKRSPRGKTPALLDQSVSIVDTKEDTAAPTSSRSAKKVTRRSRSKTPVPLELHASIIEQTAESSNIFEISTANESALLPVPTVKSRRSKSVEVESIATPTRKRRRSPIMESNLPSRIETSIVEETEEEDSIIEQPKKISVRTRSKSATSANDASSLLLDASGDDFVLNSTLQTPRRKGLRSGSHDSLMDLVTPSTVTKAASLPRKRKVSPRPPKLSPETEVHDEQERESDMPRKRTRRIKPVESKDADAGSDISDVPPKDPSQVPCTPRKKLFEDNLGTPHQGDTKDEKTSIVIDPVEPTVTSPSLMMSILNYSNQDFHEEEEGASDPANEAINSANISQVGATSFEDNMDTSHASKSGDEKVAELSNLLQPASDDEQLPPEPTVNIKPKRSPRGKTPTTEDTTPIPSSSPSGKKTTRRSRSNTPLPSSDNKEQPSPSEPIVDTKPKRSPRGKTPTPILDQSVSSGATNEDTAPVPPSPSGKKTTQRSRSKTPIHTSDNKQQPPPPEPTVDIKPKRSPKGKVPSLLDQSVSIVDTKEDTVAASSSSSSVKKTTRRSRSTTPAPDDKQPPPPEPNVNITPKRSPRGKTPTLLDQSIIINDNEAEDTASPPSLATVKKTTRRSRSKTPVHLDLDASMVDQTAEPSNVFEISTTNDPVKPNRPKKAEAEPIVRATRKAKRTVGGFAPELSTVHEDSASLIDSSVLNATLSQSQLASSVGGIETRSATARRHSPMLESTLPSSYRMETSIVEETEEEDVVIIEQPKKRGVRTRSKSGTSTTDADCFADVSASGDDSVLNSTLRPQRRRGLRSESHDSEVDLVTPSTSKKALSQRQKVASPPPKLSPQIHDEQEQESDMPRKRTRRIKPVESEDADSRSDISDVRSTVSTRSLRSRSNRKKEKSSASSRNTRAASCQ